MIEWGIERARQAALEGVKKAFKEEKLDDALIAIGQIAALRKIKRTAQEILQEFGVPDIPLATVQEEPQVLIEHSPTGRKLDIVQNPDLREELRKLGLSVRTHNLLVRAGYVDIEKLAKMTDEELLEIRLLGVVSLQELKEKLSQHFSQIRIAREAERKEKKENNRDPHFHAERIAELADEYARRLSWRHTYSMQRTGEQLPSTGAEIFESAIKQYFGEFGFFAFREEDLDGFKAHMSYTQGVGRISTIQGLSIEERINLYLHFLAHIALEHEDQADPPDSSVRFEGADKKSLSKTTLREEKEAEKWIRSFTKAIVARTEQRDVELENWDDDLEPPKKPKAQSKRSIEAQKRWGEKRKVLLEIIESSEQPMNAWDLLRAAEARGLEIYHHEIAIALKPLFETGQVGAERRRGYRGGYLYSKAKPS